MSEYVAYRDGGKTNEEGLFKSLHRLFSSGFPLADDANTLDVSQRGAGANMSVDIAIGDAFIDEGDYGYWVFTDAIYNRSITAADGSNPRIDIVVAYVDLSVVDDTNNNNPGALKFAAVAGTPAGSPTAPSDGTIQSAVGASNPFIKLASIAVGTGVTTIVDANITDLRTAIEFKGTLEGDDGWPELGSAVSVSTGYNKGNKEFDLTTSIDTSGYISPGMRFKCTRGTAAPTQCADLESSSSHYATDTSITGVSFTDDFTVEAWIKLESYGTQGWIAGRADSTPANGWGLGIDSSGRVVLRGYNAGNANFSQTLSNQSIPLGRWIHVAAVLDMSTFTAAGSPVYIDGVSVPVTVSRGGTNPTALVQASDLSVGRLGAYAGEYFDGKLSEVRLWSDVRTATEIRDNMNQALVGNEGNLDGYWKLNGGFTDSQSNHTVNSLTAQNSAVATNVDNPMKDTEYGIITKVTSTTLTVFTGTDHNIPNMTLSSPYYSTERAPFGFPAGGTKWRVTMFKKAQSSQTSASTGTWYNIGSNQISVPTGEWYLAEQGSPVVTATTNAIFLHSLSTANNSESNTEFTSEWYYSGTITIGSPLSRARPLSLTAQQTYYSITNATAGSSITLYDFDAAPLIIEAQSAYV